MRKNVLTKRKAFAIVYLQYKTGDRKCADNTILQHTRDHYKGRTREVNSVTEWERNPVLWAVLEVDGVVKVKPVQGDCITLHGPEEAELFCKCVMNHFQK